MKTTPQTTTHKLLSAGDVRQKGDLIQTSHTDGGIDLRVPPVTHAVHWSDPQPIAPHTVGRVILPADLTTTRFIRPFTVNHVLK